MMDIRALKFEGLFTHEYERGIVRITLGRDGYNQLRISFCQIDTLIQELKTLQAKINELFPQAEQIDDNCLPFTWLDDEENEDEEGEF